MGAISWSPKSNAAQLPRAMAQTGQKARASRSQTSPSRVSRKARRNRRKGTDLGGI